MNNIYALICSGTNFSSLETHVTNEIAVFNFFYPPAGPLSENFQR